MFTDWLTTLGLKTTDQTRRLKLFCSKTLVTYKARHYISKALCASIPSNDLACYYSATSVDTHTVIHENQMFFSMYAFFAERLLLLASDVELNPGPSPETQAILDAIEASNSKTLNEIASLKNEVLSVKSEIGNIKSELSLMKYKIDRVEQNQNILSDKMYHIENKMDEVEYANELAMSDIDALDMKLEKHCQMCENMENQVDKLEAEQRRNSLRIFGLQDNPNESIEELKSSVKSKVFDIACPDDVINKDTILFAKRYGVYDVEQPRMVLLKLENFNVKLKLFQGREILRKNGIRIANDLTTKQRSVLKDLKAKGQKGYFKGGQLFTIPDPEGNTEKMDTFETRVFKRGSRTLNDSTYSLGSNSSVNTVVDLSESFSHSK